MFPKVAVPPWLTEIYLAYFRGEKSSFFGFCRTSAGVSSPFFCFLDVRTLNKVYRKLTDVLKNMDTDLIVMHEEDGPGAAPLYSKTR